MEMLFGNGLCFGEEMHLDWDNVAEIREDMKLSTITFIHNSCINYFTVEQETT